MEGEKLLRKNRCTLDNNKQDPPYSKPIHRKCSLPNRQIGCILTNVKKNGTTQLKMLTQTVYSKKMKLQNAFQPMFSLKKEHWTR